MQEAKRTLFGNNPKKVHIETHYYQIVNSQRQREKSESNRRKVTHHMQGNPHNTVSGYLSRKFASKKRVGCYI